MNIPDTKFDTVLRTMPVLRHSFPDQKFDPSKSEVFAWLLAQPESAGFLFDRARQSCRIVYDHDSGAWRGATPHETESAIDALRASHRVAPKTKETPVWYSSRGRPATHTLDLVAGRVDINGESKALSLCAIARATGINRGTMSGLLNRCLKNGSVAKCAKGYYIPLSTPVPSEEV